LGHSDIICGFGFWSAPNESEERYAVSLPSATEMFHFAEYAPRPARKFQAPSTKLQTSSNNQNSKRFENWNLEFIWDLEFVI